MKIFSKTFWARLIASRLDKVKEGDVETFFRLFNEYFHRFRTKYIINFILMGQTIPLQLMKSKRKTFAISLSSIFLRYFILAIPLFVAIRSDRFNLYATIIGIFSVQIMILLDQLKKLPCFIRNGRV